MSLYYCLYISDDNIPFVPTEGYCICAATREIQRCCCASSADSDQPRHPPSLIRLFTNRLKGSEGCKLPPCGQRRLCSDWADAQADLSLLGRTTTLLVMSCRGSFVKWVSQFFCRTCFSKVRYRRPVFRPYVNPFARPSVHIYVGPKF